MSEALLRDREDARRELARITKERDDARGERDRFGQRAVALHGDLRAAEQRELQAQALRDAAIDREAAALIKVSELQQRVEQLTAALLVRDRRRGALSP